MKIKSLKPQTEDVYLDDSAIPTHRLRTVDESSYCEWQDAQIRQTEWKIGENGEPDKVYRHLAIYRSTRALLVGLNLYALSPNGDGKLKMAEQPVGEEWVSKHLEPSSITEMHGWLMDAGGLRVTHDPQATPLVEGQPAQPAAPTPPADKGPKSVWEVEKEEADAKAKAAARAPTTEGDVKN